MNDFGLSIVFGLAFGFLFGAGCALAMVHAAFRRGYRKAVADSLEPVRPRVFKDAAQTIQKQRAVAAAARAAELGVQYVDREQPRLPSGEE